MEPIPMMPALPPLIEPMPTTPAIGEVPAAEEILPPTWEYRAASEAELNTLGAEGWELVGVGTTGFHLKRPLTA